MCAYCSEMRCRIVGIPRMSRQRLFFEAKMPLQEKPDGGLLCTNFYKIYLKYYFAVHEAYLEYAESKRKTPWFIT